MLGKKAQALLIVFVFAFMGLNYPLLNIVNRKAWIAGLPVLYWYLLVCWIVIILAMYWIVKNFKNTKDRSE